MDKELFKQLTESMRQMGEIARGERAPSRAFHVDSGVHEVLPPDDRRKKSDITCLK